MKLGYKSALGRQPGSFAEATKKDPLPSKRERGMRQMKASINWTSILFATMCFTTACGSASLSEVKSKSGSNVNNGPGPVGDIVTCQSVDDPSIKFTVRHTAVLTLTQGFLESGEHDASMKCEEIKEISSVADAASSAWKCDEIRQGEGLMHVNIQTQGLSGLLMADVTVDQLFPLAPVKLATLVCQSVGE